ncbi:MAG: SpoIIE family protein phosphatase [Cellulomonadaceae bacterium]|jgi:serine phosphatase RsbU (regulator of sigma subunit)|nr:SpoIIE family protein phosphatase [Cellulomonadaceae bacterium]
MADKKSLSLGQAEAEARGNLPQSNRYNHVVRLAQAIFGMPIAALNLIGNEAQYTISAVGFPLGSIPVEESVCRITVQHEGVMEVSDLREDDRFAGISAVVKTPKIRYYAGVPVKGQSGQYIGALCVIDLAPRKLGKQQLEMLSDLGALLERELATQEEMDLAGRVQQHMVPSEPPAINGVEIAGRVQPAREAGGDYLDWFVVEPVVNNVTQPPRLEIVLGDVMGKGLAASLIASEVRAVLRGHSQYTDVGDAVARTSTTARRDLEANARFTTLWVAQLDPATGHMDYVDAGHGLAMIVSERGSRRLFQNYLPLGMPIDDDWIMASDVMEEDELLLVCSDGVFDVLDDDFNKVEKHLKYVLDPALSCQEIVDMIVAFAVQNGASDDVTAMAVRRTGETAKS